MSPEDTAPGGSSRRAFLQQAGLGGLFAAATSPSVAARERDTPLATVEDRSFADAIEESFTPAEWRTVGPFQYQRRDETADWLLPLGGELAAADGDVDVTGEPILPSAFAAAGSAEWQQQELGDGERTIPLDFVDAIDPTGTGSFLPLTGDGLTDNHQGWYGLGGIQYAMTYAFATFERDEPGIAVLETDAWSVWFNGTPIDATPTGVVLQEGRNYLLVKQLVVQASGDVTVEFRPPRAPVEVTGIERVPDLREGESTDQPAAVRVTNATPDRISDCSLTLESAEGELIEARTVDVEPPLAPFETRLVNTRVVTRKPVNAETTGIDRVTTEPSTAATSGMTTTIEGRLHGDDEHQDVTLQDTRTELRTSVRATATASGGKTDTESTELTVRSPGEAFVTTYESAIDESVQPVAIRLPSNYEKTDGPFEVAHYLHGAGVDAWSAANSVAPRDDLLVVAPETRGPAAYDHEDLGRLDDNEALAVAMERFDLDENQVYLLGHSMGGHGTWHIGLTHSDRYAAIGPQHSWLDHDTYITVPFQRDRLHTHPHLQSARDISLHKNRGGPNTENAADGNLPIFALHGGTDSSAPPMMVRSYLRMLANRGLAVDAQGANRYDGPGPDVADVAYLEVPDAGHWWDKGIGPGADVANHPDQFAWVRQTVRDPYPETLRFRTTNLAIEDGKYWVTVLLQRRAHAPTRIRTYKEGGTLHVETENVARLAIDLAVFLRHELAPTVVVDGERYELDRRMALDDHDGPSGFGEVPVAIDLVEGRIAKRALPDGVYKTAERYGPMRQVHYDPALIVYGTDGTDEETDAARALANLRSHRLADRAKAPAPVLPDTAITDGLVASYNLVLVGTPGSNVLLDRLDGETPIAVDDGAVTLRPLQRDDGPGLAVGRDDPNGTGGADAGVEPRTYHGDLGVQYVYPNPEAPDRLVQVTAGTSTEGLRYNARIDWTPTNTPSPDYMLFDDDLGARSFAACRAAGYFDVDWRLSPELGVHRSTK